MLNEWLHLFFLSFYSSFFNIQRSGVLAAQLACYMTGATWNCCRLGARYVYTIQPCTSFQCHYIKKIHRYDACEFSCYLSPTLFAEWPGSFTYYGGNTGWNEYRNNSQHRTLTLKRRILPPLLSGFEHGTFRSRVRCSNHWAISAPLTLERIFPSPVCASNVLILAEEISLVSLFIICFVSRNNGVHACRQRDGDGLRLMQ